MIMKFAIQEFKDDREYRNLSVKTIESYMLTLNEFQRFCAEHEIININDIRQSTVKSYLLYCQKERNNNPTTRNSKLHTIKIFMNYLQEIELFEAKNNPIKGLRFVKEDIQIQTFTDYQVKQMLNYYRRKKERRYSFHAYRNYTMIVFLLGTGARLGEMRNLTWHNTDLLQGHIVLYGKKREQSSIPLTEKLIKELMEYKIFCEQYFGKLSDHVFVSEDKNEPLAVDSIKGIFKRLKNDMGWTDVRVSAHTFRHYFAKQYLMSNGDLFSLQKMLRHSQISMTQRYVNLFANDLKKLNNEFNPLNNIDV
ncbi:tyrosine-type recombinase/integrase [Paenibacillus sp. KACC 21273]|uniref:tyrosine-type recombinase/integrase n=1 Tax=Paenibacillus sp. KACC 21273 TaxID=3025665 RepID=UPI002365C088|nr:tyrosine-type recombinase/integrase [Paenibacillus sp. KACC 21273]WDF52314.1 tyrosine-type recombinase/integrase [Paenibacillus sp. KACC 21273]